MVYCALFGIGKFCLLSRAIWSSSSLSVLWVAQRSFTAASLAPCKARTRDPVPDRIEFIALASVAELAAGKGGRMTMMSVWRRIGALAAGTLEKALDRCKDSSFKSLGQIQALGMKIVSTCVLEFDALRTGGCPRSSIYEDCRCRKRVSEVLPQAGSSRRCAEGYWKDKLPQPGILDRLDESMKVDSRFTARPLDFYHNEMQTWGEANDVWIEVGFGVGRKSPLPRAGERGR